MSRSPDTKQDDRKAIEKVKKYSQTVFPVSEDNKVTVKV